VIARFVATAWLKSTTVQRTAGAVAALIVIAAWTVGLIATS